MKKNANYLNIIFLTVLIFGVSAILACVDTGDDEESNSNSHLPYGSYRSTYFPTVALRSDGTFLIEHEANSEDPKDYTIEGTFSHTTDVADPENDTYGKIDLTCTALTVDGMDVTQIVGTFCDSGMSCAEPILYLDDVLLGWWAYSDNVTWGGKMRIYLNYPPSLRAASPWSGSRSLISVDPK